MAGAAVRSCSTHDLEVFPWWYDLAVTIFLVLCVNSNRLVKKIKIPIPGVTYTQQLPFLHKVDPISPI